MRRTAVLATLEVGDVRAREDVCGEVDRDGRVLEAARVNPARAPRHLRRGPERRTDGFQQVGVPAGRRGGRVCVLC